MKKIQIRLHQGQSRVWKSDARFAAMIAGTGGGKSWFGPIWLYREIQKYPKDGFLVVSPTYPMFQRIVLPRTKEFLDAVTDGEYRAGERIYYLPTGGKVFFGSADNPFSLEGVHVRAAWLDEAGQMKREAWDVALRRVGFHKGRVLLTTTPYNLGWLKTEVFDRWKAGDKNYEVVQFASILNPAYPKEEFERAKETMPDWKFKMFYLGQFARPEGLVYQDFDSGRHVVEPFEIPADWRRVIGVDFGYNNPTAAVWLAVSPDGVVYAYREYYQRNKLPEESGKEIKHLSKNERIELAACDPSEPAGIEQYRRLGIPARAGDNAVKEGIEAVITLIKSNRFFVFRGLVNLLDEIENYRWAEKHEQLKDEPVKEYDHAVDALRYAVMAVRPKARKPVPKPPGW
ncbi:MAG: terminase family protein [Peptococcaceae bacterium]|nr:terminase family protein [Peptococcaceae bacterium]